MPVVVLGASGGTGRQLVRAALDRGHEVRALVRDPSRAALVQEPRLTVVRADVHDGASIAAAITEDDVVVSGLGVTAKTEAGTLTAGARAVAAARPRRVVWLGAIGTGPSAPVVGGLLRVVLRAGLGAEYDDKVAADATVLEAGGVVLHAGPLSDRDDDPRLRAVRLDRARHRPFPNGAPRATVARLMIDAVGQSPDGLLVIQRAASA